MERLHNQENLTRKNPTSTSQQTIFVNSDEEALATLQCKKWTDYCCNWLSLKRYSKEMSAAQKQGKRHRNLQPLSCVSHSPAGTPDSDHPREAAGPGTGTHHCSSGTIRSGILCTGHLMLSSSSLQTLYCKSTMCTHIRRKVHTSSR